MPRPFWHVRSAIVSLATVLSVVATCGNAWAGDINAVARAPAELLQWHDGLIGSYGSCKQPEWGSTITAINPRDSAAYPERHGAVGRRFAAEGEFESSLSSSDPLKDAGKSAGGPP